ncbi:hypothetical protein ACL6C3_27775 [Capilliphycus salinus ALCB114379]|uniref:hypothetical protein n=1 Tax=Capilliphycus salinus TaxID=2768948 RepID=UPI0039A438FD
MSTTTLKKPSTPSRIQISIEDLPTKVAAPVKFRRLPTSADADNDQDYTYDVDQGQPQSRRRGQYRPIFRQIH